MAAEATTHAETYHGHGDPDPSKWEKATAVTGRPVDTPPPNSTLAERAAARKGDAAAGGPDPTDPEPKKAPAKKATARKG